MNEIHVYYNRSRKTWMTCRADEMSETDDYEIAAKGRKAAEAAAETFWKDYDETEAANEYTDSLQYA